MTVATNRYSSAGLNGFTTARRRGLTPADLAYISALRAKNRSWQTIATIMGRPRADIQAAAAVEAHTQARAKVFDWTPEHLETARVYYRAGNNPTMLAIKAGCSIQEAEEQLDHQRALSVQRQRLATSARRQAKRAAAAPAKPKVKKAPPPPRLEPKAPTWATTLPQPRPRRDETQTGPTLVEVAIITAEAGGLSLAAICNPSRERRRVHARWIAAWAMRKYCVLDGGPPSYPEIGRVLGGYDHTTVLYGVRRLEEFIARGQFQDVLERVADRLAKPALDGRVTAAKAAFSAALTERARALAVAA